MTGKLIVLEGLDGAGTTTQVKRLVEHLRASGRAAHATREPSDGPIGKLIREMLTGGHAIPGQSLSQSTFGLLFAADRLDHLQREVEPQLAAGAIVVSDRWYHSSLAYQGTGADRDWITMLNARARKPDLTIFLEVRPEVAAKRRLAEVHATGGGMVVTSCATCAFMLERNAPPSVEVANLSTAMAQLSGTSFTPPITPATDDDV